MDAKTQAKNKSLDLKISATNGATWETADFKTKDKVGHVARKAVKHFVHKGVMDDGDYALALLEHGQPRVLDDADTLAGAGVHDHAKLALVNRAPQVDGACIRR
jgi:hypothetical protein